MVQHSPRTYATLLVAMPHRLSGLLSIDRVIGHYDVREVDIRVDDIDATLPDSEKKINIGERVAKLTQKSGQSLVGRLFQISTVCWLPSRI